MDRLPPSPLNPQEVSRPDRVEGYTFIIQFEITSVCNLRCSHCYDDTETHTHMPFDQCTAVLDTFLAFCQRWKRYPAIWLTGGEPTIHPHFWEIIDYIEEKMDSKDYNVAILSNGINITPDFIQKLGKYKMNKYVQISVDGACAETHDTIRGKGSFDKAVRALKVLQSASIEKHMHFVVHKGNYADGFKMTDLARDLGADVLTVTRLVPWGRGRELYEKMLSPEQVQKLFRKLSDDFDVISAQNPPKPYISRNRCDWPVIYGDPKTPEAFTKNGITCGAAQSYINVMQNGDVYPCRRMPIKVGNVLEEDLLQIWQHPLMWKLRQKHKFVQGKCKTCYFSATAPEVCSGGASCIAYACYQDPFQPDPQCSVNPS